MYFLSPNWTLASLLSLCEFVCLKNIFLRLGAGNFQRPLKDDNSGSRDFSFYPTAGIGLKMKKIAIDYAMSNVASTGVGLYSHYFSAFLNF